MAIVCVLQRVVWTRRRLWRSARRYLAAMVQRQFGNRIDMRDGNCIIALQRGECACGAQHDEIGAQAIDIRGQT